MKRMITFYNSELDRFDAAYASADRKMRAAALDDFIDTSPTRISWTHGIKQELAKGKRFDFDDVCLTPSLYRPFTRQWLYYNRNFNERVYQMPRVFPMGDVTVKNRIIVIEGSWRGNGNFALMETSIAALLPDGGCQCFPRYLYEETPTTADDGQMDMLAGSRSESGRQRQDAITDEGLTHFQAAYPNEVITKDDLFYYVYGLLHSEDYRARYADNLSKQLPRIPAVKKVADFRAFVEAGRALGDLHCNYETVELYPVTFERGDTSLAPPADPAGFYRVEQMKFAGKRPNLDKTTVVYNASITITGIPLAAYDYVVNGKSALDWVMERQCVKTDKASGIVNDANRYANETVGDPAYPLKLLQRVITVSLETMKIVRSLPKLDIMGPVDSREFA
jgi:predicted helicase